MKYDLHVHINIHAEEGEMDRYEYFAKINGLEVVGFLIHYNPKMSKRELRDYRDFVESLNIRAFAGLEIYYPASKIPTNFDFYTIHFSNILVDADILSKFENIIIAHPFAYGMRLDSSAFPIIKKRNIAVECNSAHFENSLISFYRELEKEGVVIPFGSDAHTPEEMGAMFEDLSHIFTPFPEVERHMFL